jgi:hypothetical protein
LVDWMALQVFEVVLESSESLTGNETGPAMEGNVVVIVWFSKLRYVFD